MRGLRREKRDIKREVQVDQQIEQSTARLVIELQAEQESPSQRIQRDEAGLELADFLKSLPEAQREALVLQHWHGWTVSRIAQHMDRTPAAVAGLLKRGLRELRTKYQVSPASKAPQPESPS